MKLSALLWQSLITLTLVVCSIWIYDRYLKTAVIIDASPAYFNEVSLPEDHFRRADALSNRIPGDFVSVANKAKSSVVYITSYEKVDNSLFKDEYKREKGSGVIISPDGDIVTNYHVIAKADYIEITLEDKREYRAEVVGTDQATDLALLKIEAVGLPFQRFANSDSLQVGEWVLAIGNPFGLQSTVTAGIVSAKARNIDVIDQNDIESFIQTDAAINPGSSGGALVSTSGGLMGIYSAILSKSGNYEGLSFAIPGNLARKVVVDIKEFGAVQRGKIGIGITDVNADIADRLDLPFIKGVYINSINLNSAAAAAGIKKSDVITAIGENEINSSSEFYEILNKYRPGDLITVVYYRGARMKSSKITLRNYLNTIDYITVPNDKILRDLGIEVRDLNSIEKARVKTEGIIVISVSKGSKIDQTNMEPGFIVEYFNEIRIKNAKEFVALLKNSEDEVTLRGFYERYPDVYPYTFQLDN